MSAVENTAGTGIPDLHSAEGAAALADALAEAEPTSLAAATRLRRTHSPELAAAALAQTELRRRARTKFGEVAAGLFLTPDALEQATRPAVAAWRARRLVDEGVRRVIDLGCGIGADSLAFVDAGLEVTAVELDPTTAAHARANLDARWSARGRAGIAPEVITGDAVALAAQLVATAGPETCVFIDPARRTDQGRTWQVEAFTPPWDFVTGLFEGPHATVVKLGPGVPKNLLPDDVEALWVGHGPDVVECSLWRTPGARPVHAAVLIPRDGAGGPGAPQMVHRLDHVPAGPLPVGPVGRYLVEPHGAVIRAGALEGIDASLWLLDAQIAYLSGDQPVHSPFGTCFEVLEVLDANPKVLKAWVRQHRIGTLEIKKRALDLDPAALRRKLAPKGSGAATLVLARTGGGTRALVVRRIAAASAT